MFQNIKIPFTALDVTEFTPAEQIKITQEPILFPGVTNSNTPCKFDAVIDQENGINIRNNYSSSSEGITVTDDSYFSGKIVQFKGKIVITNIGYALSA